MLAIQFVVANVDTIALVNPANAKDLETQSSPLTSSQLASKHLKVSGALCFR